MPWYASESDWLRAGMVLCALAAALGVLTSRRARWPGAIVTGLVLAACASFAWAIGVRWFRSGQGPFLTLFEVLLSNLFSLSFVYLGARVSSASARAVAGPFLSVLSLFAAWALTVPRDVVPLPPTFDNPWLWVHVLSGKVFLAFCLMAACAGAMLLTGRARAEDRLDAFVWRALQAAFLFEGVMLLAGAAWASDAWGRYWGWDPLETWALVTWLALGTLLHARIGFRIPPWLGWAGACIVFALALLTFLGVPFLSLGPHKGVI